VEQAATRYRPREVDDRRTSPQSELADRIASSRSARLTSTSMPASATMRKGT
jgi:hypothetical protein